MTFGSKNRAMGVAGTRIIIFNGLLIFFWFGEEKKARQEQGWEGRTRLRRGLCWSYPLWIQTPKLVRSEKALELPEHISRAASRTNGLVRKFEEYKEFKKKSQNLAQNLVQVHSSCGSLANILGTATDSQPKALLWFLPLWGDLRKKFQSRIHCLSQLLRKVRHAAWSHCVSTISAGKDEGLFLRSSNGTQPQAPHIPDHTVQSFLFVLLCGKTLHISYAENKNENQKTV